jgi:hypothetical protein
MFTRHLPFRILCAQTWIALEKTHVHCKEQMCGYTHACIHIMYLHGLVGGGACGQCKPSCLRGLLYMLVAVCACACVSPEMRAHAQGAQACTQGVCHWHRSLATWIVVSLRKPFIYVRRHMCLYCVCVRWNDVHSKFLTRWDCFKTDLSATLFCLDSMTSFPWFVFALCFLVGVALIFCQVVNVFSC